MWNPGLPKPPVNSVPRHGKRGVMQKFIVSIAAIICIFAAGYSCQSRKTDTSGTGADSVKAVGAVGEKTEADMSALGYLTDIRPILAGNCIGCHEWTKTYPALMAQVSEDSETSGLRIVCPAKPDSSVIVWRLEGMLPSEEKIMSMPKGRNMLPVEMRGAVRAWIAQGAPELIQ